MDFEIRQIERRDLPSCIQIVRQNWNKETARSAAVELDQTLGDHPWRPVIYVAVNEQQVLGCGGYIASWLHYGIYDITWVNVLPEYQRSGIGRAIVDKCLDDIRSLGHLAMLSTTVPNYYEKHWRFRPTFRHDTDKTIMYLHL